MSSPTARVTPDLLQALAVLSDATVRRYTVKREDLKPQKNLETGHIFVGDQQAYYLQFFNKLYQSQKEG